MSTDTVWTGQPLKAGTWLLDPNHSGVHFKVRHIGLANVRGRFNSFTAALHIGETLAETSVEAVIDLSSVDTNQPDRDAYLRSTDFFSTDQHPEMVFRSISVNQDGDDFRVEGDLTINGITKPVVLNLEFGGVQDFPGDGRTHAGFSATAEINRDDFDIDFNMPLGIDRFALGKNVSIEIDVQFIAPEPA